MSAQANVFHPTLADLALGDRTLPRDAALVAAGSLVVAALAQVAIVLPFSPVPLTGQTLGVMLVGLSLGSRRGALAMLAYLAEGAVGLPVFAGFTGSVAVFAGPTGGYLLAFPVAAFVAGLLVERLGADRSFARTVLALVAAHAVIYACGMAWLAAWAHAVGAPSSPAAIVASGMLAFLPGDAMKAAVAAVLVPGVRRVLAGRR